MHSEMIAPLAVQALDQESGLRGKPGLVSPGYQGAHDDMDYELFLRSSKSLRSSFARCAAVGRSFSGRNLCEMLSLLRPIGIEAEKLMLKATQGVNTHKGAIFSLGLLSAAAGYCLRFDQGAFRGTKLGDRICLITAEICQGLVAKELGDTDTTAGARQYIQHGIRGARGEAEDGYPLIRDKLLPLVRQARNSKNSLGRERNYLNALLVSISQLQDTCLLSRGGLAGLEFAKLGATEALALGGAETLLGRTRITQLSLEFCAARLSPGGSADMLAATLFLDSLENTVTNSIYRFNKSLFRAKAPEGEKEWIF